MLHFVLFSALTHTLSLKVSYLSELLVRHKSTTVNYSMTSEASGSDTCFDHPPTPLLSREQRGPTQQLVPGHTGGLRPLGAVVYLEVGLLH